MMFSCLRYDTHYNHNQVFSSIHTHTHTHTHTYFPLIGSSYIDMTQIALSLLHASGNSLEDHSTMLQRSLWLASSIGELPLLGLQQFVTSVLGMVIFLSSELLCLLA